MGTDVRIGLADAISQLRAELSRARLNGEGKDIRFGLGEIEVELMLEFGISAEGGGGIKLFSFVDVSGKAAMNNKSGHKLKFTLTVAPEGEASAGKFLVSDSDGPGPQLAGPALSESQ